MAKNSDTTRDQSADMVQREMHSLAKSQGGTTYNDYTGDVLKSQGNPESEINELIRPTMEEGQGYLGTAKSEYRRRDFDASDNSSEGDDQYGIHF